MRYYATSFLIVMLAIFASPSPLTESSVMKESTFAEQSAQAEEVSLTKAKALQLSQEFINKLQTKTDSQYRVKDYSSKSELIKDVRHVASKQMASDYVNGLFEEKKGKLYVVPTDLPPWVEKGQNFELKKLSESSYHLVQHNKSDLYGEYSITLGFEKVNSHWVITFASIS
ncbi:hypothetical protein QUF79_19315 [Fictibacillus enclensis]|nr:hypothetical protein [Fictibacillus enclensis]